MSRSLHLSIPEPCHEGWDKMSQVEKGRFCQSCQKTVVDFSQMSDNEVIEYISKASTQTCGHFYTDQLERSLVEQAEPKKSWWRRGWNVAAASLLFSTASYAQGNIKVKKAKTHTVAMEMKGDDCRVRIDGLVSLNYNLPGTVLNSETLLPIEGVSVVTSFSREGVISDSNGRFVAKQLPTDTITQLEVSAIGYKSIKVPVSFFDARVFEPLTIYLDQDFVEMGTVVVTRTVCYTKQEETTGLLLTRVEKEYTLFDTFMNSPIVRRIADTFSLFSGFKVYPNPAIAGSVINVQMDFFEKGTYKVELFNPIGQLVNSRKVDLVKDQQVVSIPLERSLSKGMYIVRINHESSKKRYTKKVVVN